MKTLMMALFFFALTTVTAMAQDSERANRSGGQMQEMMKERLKTDLKLTDAQIDTVFIVQRDFQMKSRDVRMSESISADDKKNKMLQLNEERKTKLKTTLNDEQFKKLEEFYENMRKMREQRQGQNGN